MPIVIVDDCAVTAAIIKGIARDRGTNEVLKFTDPESALDYLRVDPADLVIVDYAMPGMNGVQLTGALRCMPRHEGTPVVMLTGSEDPQVERLAAAAGVTEFLRKPVKIGELKAIVGKLLPNGGWPFIDRRSRDATAPPEAGERRQAAVRTP